VGSEEGPHTPLQQAVFGPRVLHDIPERRQVGGGLHVPNTHNPSPLHTVLLSHFRTLHLPRTLVLQGPHFLLFARALVGAVEISTPPITKPPMVRDKSRRFPSAVMERVRESKRVPSMPLSSRVA
jgi:hypothetical protein